MDFPQQRRATSLWISNCCGLGSRPLLHLLLASLKGIETEVLGSFLSGFAR